MPWRIGITRGASIVLAGLAIGSPALGETKSAATQSSRWWAFIDQRQSLLDEHAREAGPAAPWFAPGGKDIHDSIQIGGLKRTYLIHVPSTYDGKTPLPLIVNLHGGGLDGACQAYYSGMSDIADQESFLVVYPDAGAGDADNPARKLNWDGQLNRSDDDVVYLRTLLEKLEHDYAVDRRHVMVAGASAGAIMAYRFGLEGGDLISAVGAVSGSFSFSMLNGEPPAMKQAVAPVSLMALHGKLDKAVPYDGVTNERMRLWPVERTVQFWVGVDGCDHDAIVDRHSDYTVQTWKNGHQGTEVRLVTIDKAGHGIPSRATEDGPVLASEQLYGFLIRDQSNQIHAVRDSLKHRLGAGLAVRAAESMAERLPGLSYAYFEGAWDQLPDVDKLQPQATGTCVAADLGLVKHRATDFAIVFTGYLKVPEDGVYTLSSASDDGSSIEIGQTLVVDNDGLHDAIERCGTVRLAKGCHAIRIRYLQRDFAAVLKVSITREGSVKRVLGEGDFVHGALKLRE